MNSYRFFTIVKLKIWEPLTSLLNINKIKIIILTVNVNICHSLKKTVGDFPDTLVKRNSNESKVWLLRFRRKYIVSLYLCGLCHEDRILHKIDPSKLLPRQDSPRRPRGESVLCAGLSQGQPLSVRYMPTTVYMYARKHTRSPEHAYRVSWKSLGVANS